MQGSNTSLSMRRRKFLEQWALANEVERTKLERIFTAVSNWSSKRGLLIPNLDIRAFYDPAQFAWTKELVRLTSRLRVELETVSTNMPFHPETDELVEQGAWRAYFFWRSSVEVKNHPTSTPTAIEAVRLAPGGGYAGNAYFSVIEARTRLRRHIGHFNGRLRCHLGLEVPENCYIEVDGERQIWQNGKCLVFNDVLPHSVENVATTARAVYVLDFWHPDLMTEEQAALGALLAARF